MNGGKKTAMIIALICITIGLVLTLIAFLVIGFDFTKLNNRHPKTVEHTVGEAFTKINVDVVEADIKLLPSTDGKARVVCDETDKIVHRVYVENGTLKIEHEDLRAWYEYIGFSWNRMSVTVYLPKTEYETVRLKSVSGNIVSDSKLTFGDTITQTTSGEITLSNLSTKNLLAESTSGNLRLEDVNTSEDLSLKTVSGNIHWKNGTARALNGECTSGNITLDHCKTNQDMLLKTVSGEITLRACDAAELEMETVSGNVYAALLSEKDFITDTTSGDIRVPHGYKGGKCRISTVSGNITATIQK